MGQDRSNSRAARAILAAGALILASARAVAAQTPPLPDPILPPRTGSGDPGAPTPPDPAGSDRVAELEARVRQLELMIQQMAKQQGTGDPPPGAVAPGGNGSGGTAPEGSSASGTAASRGNDGGTAPDPGGRPSTDSGPSSNTTPAGAGPGSDTPGTTAPSAMGGPLSPGQSSPPNPPASNRFRMPATTINSALTGRFGPGFEWKTADDEFVLQFHDLTQIDGRFYEQGGQNPVHDTFAIPRQWWMFSGRITKPYEYFLSFQNAFDTVNLLDDFINIHYDDRLQFKFGRYKTPFTYEFYTVPVQGTIDPELSLFFNNFALNRSDGLMAWGRLFNETVPLDYAVGIFNSARNSYLDTSDGKNVLAYLNWRPFATFVESPLENFVFGGSVMAGDQINAPVPAVLRTTIPTAGNAIAGVPFLTWNANTRESGPRTFWDFHAAWYYKHLSLIAEWQSGFQDYALASSLAKHDRVGVESYYVQAAYFVTGETVASRGVVKPLRDFEIRRGKMRGPGAIELTARINSLNLTRNVFTAGLADADNWASNLYTVEPGINWYPNQYGKVTFIWNHAVFGTPVLYNATERQKTADLFWVRYQLYF